MSLLSLVAANFGLEAPGGPHPNPNPNPGDTTAPTLISSNPADNATDVVAGADIVLNFSEAVQMADASKIALYKADGTKVEANVTVAGQTITIDPNADLAAGGDYYVKAEAGAITDLAGNALADLDDAEDLNFKVVGGAGDKALTVNEAGSHNVGDGDYTVTFEAGKYDVTLENFGPGDKIDLPDDFFATATIQNLSGDDGQIVVQGNTTAGDVITITLTGVPTEQDGAVFSVDTFNAAFGEGSLV